jgi:hypothetical protein
MGIHVSRPHTSNYNQLKNEQSPKIIIHKTTINPTGKTKRIQMGISYIKSPYAKENKFIVNQ